jgi:Tol biopolymer transport system component
MRTLLCMLAAFALLGADALPTPEIFAPGVISGPANDGSPAFTPGGNTLYFTRSGAGGGAILESHLVNGSWSPPVLAPFSGQWSDQQPAIAPNGSFMIFVSTRPAPDTPEHGARIWRMERTNDGWGTPALMPPAVNISPRVFAPSIAADGSIYFLNITINGGAPEFQIYCAPFVNGAYRQAEPLPFSTPKTADVDPAIAPDQSYMVFASSGRRSGDTHEHLFIVTHHGGVWGQVHPLRYAGDDDNGGSNDNEPRISPDGRTLYFDSDRTLTLHFPRTRDQALADLARIDSWDNGNTNVWTIPL